MSAVTLYNVSNNASLENKDQTKRLMFGFRMNITRADELKAKLVHRKNHVPDTLEGTAKDRGLG